MVGIVAAVSQFIADHGGWLVESNYHAEPESGWFFMRNEIKAGSFTIGLDQFRAEFSELASSYEMRWAILMTQWSHKCCIAGQSCVSLSG